MERLIQFDDIITSSSNEKVLPLIISNNEYDKADWVDEEGRESADFLQRTGLMTGPVIQIDIAAVTQKQGGGVGLDRAICDKNCEWGEDGKCPARIFAPENKGLKRRDVAPKEKILQAIQIAASGITHFNKRFIQNGLLDRYCKEFNIPENIKKGIQINLQRTDHMINIFGGNAEMNVDAIDIAKECKKNGLRTTLTTTGGILLRGGRESDSFLDKLLTGSVDTLAVSAEFESTEHIMRLYGMSSSQLREEVRAIDPRLGQLRKGVESINVIKLQNQYKSYFPKVLMNLVVHKGVLEPEGEKIEEIIETLKEIAPNALINPYPLQSFRKKDSDRLSFNILDLPAMRNFVSNRRVEQRRADPHVALRPHYFDMLCSIVETYGISQKAAEMISGEGTWKCYEAPYEIGGAGAVFQIGASPYPRNLAKFPHAGGYAACFWDNKTITNSNIQVWDMTPAEAADHIDCGMSHISKTIEDPCRGCLMPRLVGDIRELELGLDPTLKSAYLVARKESVGF